jgi:UDP-2-acetamido-2,6-beta-L-arabino-hexul-4-ose reductase
MKRVLITGSNGFIGKNLAINLKYIPGFEVIGFDINDGLDFLNAELKKADFVFHLAGINRPEKNEGFQVNIDLTKLIVDSLINFGMTIPLVLSSSIQAELDNEYGKSKLEAEKQLEKYKENGGEAYIFRLTNVFGKWSRPNYNSVVATFCYNIANDINISISDVNKELQLVHIDDVIKCFIDIVTGKSEYNNLDIITVDKIYCVTLGQLAELIRSFKSGYTSELLPDIGNDFIKKLHSTYLSYVSPEGAIYKLNKQIDNRGYLVELIKSKSLGQIFISKTKPGITRGNHFHNLKIEKFCVIEGEALIKLRHLMTNETFEYIVNGDEASVVNILPGYTHSITNTGIGELITLFWANEPFDKDNPDTFYDKV